MKFNRSMFAVAAFLAFPLLAKSQPVSGPYIAGGLGANWLLGTDITGSNEYASPSKIGYDFDVGYVGVLSLGWGFGNGLRLEIEGSYRSNEVAKKNDGVAGVSGPGNGTVLSYGMMGNIIYDFNSLTSSLGGITPYIGAGAGYIWNKYEAVGGPCPPGFCPEYEEVSYNYNGTSGAFAYQFIVGAALPISNVPGLSLTAEYRFLGTLGHRMNGVYTHKSAPLWDPDSGWTQELDVDRFKVDVDNLNHSLLVGLRYVFNAAPTVASVVPVAASRSYVVFFDWGRSDLTDRARQVIGEAATSRGSSVTRIEVNGFTDRSGPTDYNMQLSIRRANAVAAELVRRGVPRNEIVTRGFGEEGNLVSTADGVREPQNRRVEIVLK